MATDLENAQSAYSGALAKLAAALQGDYSAAIEFKPDFNAANSLDRAEYMRVLMDIIGRTSGIVNSLDSYEITSEMTT